MKGVIATRAPRVPIVDVAHGIPPQQILAGALVLRAAAPYFPNGTVHVAVVDPGVGTERRALCVETEDAYLVGPDNGVLSLAAPAERVRRIVELTNDRFFLSPRSRTFDGRDVFAPVAAALATGTPIVTLGDERTGLVRIEVPVPKRDGATIRGQVIYVDGFGNLATNIDEKDLPGAIARIEVGGRSFTGPATASATYAAVIPGTVVAVVNSWGVLEIAVRNGDARAELGLDVGAPVTVVLA
jgi:S-adenosylmethionine hydrolase